MKIGDKLVSLVGTTYGKHYHHHPRFRQTIDRALHGSTEDDVLAILVRGLAESCDDHDALLVELRRLAERAQPTPLEVTA